MPLNRLVALLTPVFALAAGACATWLAEHFPGVNISQDMLQQVFIAGALAVLAPALHWLHGLAEVRGPRRRRARRRRRQ